MKGVILAGGLGTRLAPLTWATNKHLLPVYDKPMVFRPIETLVNAGITEVLVVTGGPHAGHFIRVLKNGENLGLKHLEYAYQEGEGGISDALSKAEDFSDNGSICVILGDNCTDADISKEVKNFKDGAHVFFKEVKNPQRFGVLTFDEKNNPKEIIEKPKKPQTNYAQTGLYIYDSSAFKKIKTLKPSQRGELEITDLNNLYIKENKFRWSILNGFWSDAGTIESLYEVGNYWASKAKEK